MTKKLTPIDILNTLYSELSNFGECIRRDRGSFIVKSAYIYPHWEYAYCYWKGCLNRYSGKQFIIAKAEGTGYGSWAGSVSPGFGSAVIYSLNKDWDEEYIRKKESEMKKELGVKWTEETRKMFWGTWKLCSWENYNDIKFNGILKEAINQGNIVFSDERNRRLFIKNKNQPIKKYAIGKEEPSSRYAMYPGTDLIIELERDTSPSKIKEKGLELLGGVKLYDERVVEYLVGFVKKDLGFS